MMEQFEKEMKKYFQDRKIKTSEKAWERMEALLDENKIEQKKAKSFFFLIPIAASVLLFVGLWLFFKPVNNVEIVPVENKAIVVEEIQQIEKKQNVEETVVVKENKNVLVSNHSKPKKVMSQKTDEILVQNYENKIVADVSSEEKDDILFVETINDLKMYTNTEIKVDRNKLLKTADIERKNDYFEKEEESILKPQKVWREIKQKHIRVKNHHNIAKIE